MDKQPIAVEIVYALADKQKLLRLSADPKEARKQRAARAAKKTEES